MRVALPVPLDRLFDYRVLPSHEALVEPGSRVRVNFGGQPLIGVVVPSDWVTEEDAATANPNRSLADIESVIDEEPVVGSDMLELLRVPLATSIRRLGSRSPMRFLPAQHRDWPVPGLSQLAGREHSRRERSTNVPWVEPRARSSNDSPSSL